MDINKKSMRRLISLIIPVFFAGFLRTVVLPVKVFALIFIHFGETSSVIFLCVIMYWYFNVRRSFPQKQLRYNVAFFTAMFILLKVLTIIKYYFVIPGSSVARYLWYAYYFPLTFAPVFMLFASLHFGKPDNYRISRKWYWAFLPAALISAAILTNDLHQLAFGFPNGFSDWEHGYTHGIFYYTAFIWSGLGMLGVIILAVRSTFSRRLFKTAWLPLAIIVIIGLYPLLYTNEDEKKLFIQAWFQMNDFICISCILLWESFVISKIVVSNSDYSDIFAASSLNAGLADADNQVQQVSASGLRPLPEQLRAAQNGEILLPDGDALLKSRAVSGGWFYWTEDVKELRRLREALTDTADFLEEENAMLRISAQIEEGRRQTEEQTKLYDRVTEALRPQLEKLDELLKHKPEEDETFRDSLKTAGILVAYIKRRSSLLIQADIKPVFTGTELALCFEESAKALRMSDISCELEINREISISAEDADRLYDAFETAIESALPSLRKVRISLYATEKEGPLLKLVLNSDTRVFKNEAKEVSV